ncbi:MAG: class I SAM-dependent methyltransferase [Candidatus Niyogibacteria bacterium]|nr:class I SAM-dependent methyltransferase [Candidatus Niyogibacteria bacterium]
MKDATIFIKELWRGKDLYRILMNLACRNVSLHGKVLDIGSGLNKASYHRFLKKSENVEIIALDLGFDKVGGGSHINLEQDALSYADHSVDMVLAFNILEHLYNYSFLLSEIKRVLKPEGRVVGAVPFLVGYHPDPRDYWRYTSESLRKILEDRGFKNIEISILGRGPFSAGYSQAEFVFPRFLKIFILPCVLLLDKMILDLKPKMNREKFALGLFFRSFN